MAKTVWDGHWYRQMTAEEARREVDRLEAEALTLRTAAQTSDRFWGTIKNAVDDLESGVEDWTDLAEVRRNYRSVLSDLRKALATSAARGEDQEERR